METCKQCGKPLTERQAKHHDEFCSHSCAGKWRYRFVQREFICQHCGKKYTKKNSGTKIGIKYCGQECAHLATRGVKKTDEHKRKIAEAQKHVRIEGEFICDRCNRRFVSNTACRAHKAHCGHVFGIFRCPKCDRSFRHNAALSMHKRFCFDDEKSIEWKTRLKRSVREGQIRKRASGEKTQSSNTDIEIRFRDLLVARGISFVQQYLVQGINHQFDFYIEKFNLLVELDGDWWHGNKGKVKILLPWQRRQYHIDCNYTQYAVDGGFRIIRFWGSSISENVEECLAEAMEYGQSGKYRDGGRRRCL